MARKNSFIPLVRAELVATYFDYISDYEKQLLPKLAESGVPFSLGDYVEDGYLSREVMYRFFTIIFNELSVAAFVKMVVACCKINAVKATNGKRLTGTVREALIRYSELAQFDSTDTVFELDGNWFTLKRKEQTVTGDDLVTVMVIVSMVQLLAGQKWMPSQVRIRSEKTHKIAMALNSPSTKYLVKKTYPSVYIPDSILDLPVVAPVSDAIETSYLELHTFKYSLKKLLEPYVSGSTPTITEAAGYANMSVRTLQRRLESEGFSYSDVIFELIDEMTCDALIHSTESIADLSHRLGYSHASHMIRAFKKKFEMTPNQFREKYGPNEH